MYQQPNAYSSALLKEEAREFLPIPQDQGEGLSLPLQAAQPRTLEFRNKSLNCPSGELFFQEHTPDSILPVKSATLKATHLLPTTLRLSTPR